MSAKHTPGPIPPEYIESGTFVGGEEDASIAGIKCGGECVIADAKHKALIAAAPDLLAAARAAHETLYRMLMGLDAEGLHEESLADLRDAINKAEGYQ